MTAVEFPAGVEQVPDAVAAVLTDFFAAAEPVLSAISPTAAEAGRRLADFVLSGGKRVRPAFIYTGWRCGVDDATGVVQRHAADTDTVLRVCAAIELIQACALVHDDIIDRSETRRGRPTVHRTFAEHHTVREWSGESDHYGESVAILLGDLALAWADDLVHGYRPDGTLAAGGPLPARAGRLWSRMRTEVLGGQLLDITNEAAADASVHSAYRVMEFKTAAYTVARPLEIGAALADASDTLIADLRLIGTELGLAFQLRDDLLGVFGDPVQTGKPSGDDLISGKRTTLLATGLELADERDPAAADALRGAVGRDLSADELAEARRTLVDAGAVAASERQIEGHLDTALDRIDRAPTGAAARGVLAGLARDIAFRNA